jgi:uncharacterized phage protein gp47/JayE
MADLLTPAGLITETATEIKADFDEAFKAVYGDSIGSDPGGAIPPATSIGQEIAILVDAKSSSSEALKEVLAAYDPDQAEDVALDVLCALTGTRRKAASKSTVLAAAAGTIGTPLEAGRVARVQDVGTRFTSLADATLAAVAATWAAATDYLLNDLVNANGYIWQCIAPGASALPAPVGAADEQADGGGVLWYRVGTTGQGIALIVFQAEEVGPLAAVQGALNEIATPVSGWAALTNGLGTDATSNGLGQNIEGNAPLRVRRRQELQTKNGGPADSIRAALLALDDVVACTVFVNNTDVADADGLPPHSVDVMILAPNVSDQALAEAVWAAVGAGTATSNAVGTPVTKTVTDASGNPQTVRYSRPTPVPIFILATVYYDPAQWDVPNVNAAIGAGTKSALCTFGGSYYQTGFNVRVLPLGSAIIDGPSATETDDVGTILPVIPAPAGSIRMQGIVDTALQIKRSGGIYGTSPVVIAKGEIATFDPSDITVTPTPEVP